MIQHGFRYRLSSLLLVVTIVAFICGWPQMRLSYLCWRMSNEDITVRGVDLHCNGFTATIVTEFGLNARTKLKTLLTDPGRFAAAHAALAETTGVKRGGTLGPAPGSYVANNLHYDISGKGVVSIHMLDNEHLEEWWIDYVGNHTGIQIWDEESERLVWYNEWKQNAK